MPKANGIVVAAVAGIVVLALVVLPRPAPRAQALRLRGDPPPLMIQRLVGWALPVRRAQRRRRRQRAVARRRRRRRRDPSAEPAAAAEQQHPAQRCARASATPSCALKNRHVRRASRVSLPYEPDLRTTATSCCWSTARSGATSCVSRKARRSTATPASCRTPTSSARPTGSSRGRRKARRMCRCRRRSSDFIIEMPRGAQVIYPKDIGAILMLADIASRAAGPRSGRRIGRAVDGDAARRRARRRLRVARRLRREGRGERDVVPRR